MFVLSILLIAGVVAGIAWPLIQRRRIGEVAAVDVADGAPAATGTTAGATTTGAIWKRSGRASRLTEHEEQLCPYCSRMNPPNRDVCLDCGNALPVNNLSAIFEGVDREEAIRELKQGAVLFAAMILAMCLANWMATPWKIAILLGTLAFLAFRFHRSLIED